MVRSRLALALTLSCVSLCPAAELHFTPLPRLVTFWSEAEEADRDAAGRAWRELEAERAGASAQVEAATRVAEAAQPDESDNGARPATLVESADPAIPVGGARPAIRVLGVGPAHAVAESGEGPGPREPRLGGPRLGGPCPGPARPNPRLGGPCPGPARSSTRPPPMVLGGLLGQGGGR